MLVRPALLLAAAVLAAAVSAAPAGAARLAPSGTGADRVALVAASGGRAVLAWNAHGAAGDAVQIAQLAPGTGFAGGQTALQAPTVLVPAAAALDPSGGAQVLAATGVRANLPTQFVAARRAAATGPFGTPALVGTGSFAQIVSAAANAHGDLAAVVATGPRHAVLVTAPAGGAFGAPQDINPGGLADTAAVGLGRDGALVVPYYDGVSRALVRRGAVGGALGAPQALAQVRNRPDFSAAIDDAGTATIAFGRSLGRDGIGVAVARARSGSAFGVPVTLDRGPNAQVPQVAAAGSTTAVTWLSLTARERVRVVIARDAGRLERPLTPATAIFEQRGEAGRVPSEAGVPTVAVDRAGDVLLAYPYGPFNAVHETLLRAGSTRFVAPRILSALGHGGVPAAALTDDRRPIVAWADGDGVFAATGLGRPVFTRAPDVTLSRPSVAELRRTGAVTVTARCAPRCEIVANARLTTGRGGPGLVISRQARPPRVIAANAPLRLRFALTPAGRTALQATGRAQVKVIVTAANVSGAARTARQAFDVGRRSR